MAGASERRAVYRLLLFVSGPAILRFPAFGTVVPTSTRVPAAKRVVGQGRGGLTGRCAFALWQTLQSEQPQESDNGFKQRGTGSVTCVDSGLSNPVSCPGCVYSRRLLCFAPWLGTVASSILYFDTFILLPYRAHWMFGRIPAILTWYDVDATRPHATKQNCGGRSGRTRGGHLAPQTDVWIPASRGRQNPKEVDAGLSPNREGRRVKLSKFPIGWKVGNGAEPCPGGRFQ